MAKKMKKKIVHIGMGRMLCGISDKHVARAVWSNRSLPYSAADISKYNLHSYERLCHKCKHIHEMNRREEG